MLFIHHEAPRRDEERPLLVMLPGVGMEPEDFAAHGLVRLAQEHDGGIKVVAARPELDLYLDGTVAPALESAIIAPARHQGLRPIWLLGISLGGIGALLHARAYPGGVAGIVLLSPFLGTPGLIAEVAEAGGLGAWQPGEVAANDVERQVLAWLATLRRPPLQLYLGYGRDDRFARGQALLAEHLPSDRVVLADGGHDWPTWRGLWRRILALNPFATGLGR